MQSVTARAGGVTVSAPKIDPEMEKEFARPYVETIMDQSAAVELKGGGKFMVTGEGKISELKDARLIELSKHAYDSVLIIPITIVEKEIRREKKIVLTLDVEERVYAERFLDELEQSRKERRGICPIDIHALSITTNGVYFGRFRLVNAQIVPFIENFSEKTEEEIAKERFNLRRKSAEERSTVVRTIFENAQKPLSKKQVAELLPERADSDYLGTEIACLVRDGVLVSHGKTFSLKRMPAEQDISWLGN